MLRTFAIVIAGAGIFASLPLTNARACDDDRYPCPIRSEALIQETVQAPDQPAPDEPQKKSAQPQKKAKQPASTKANAKRDREAPPRTPAGAKVSKPAVPEQAPAVSQKALDAAPTAVASPRADEQALNDESRGGSLLTTAGAAWPVFSNGTQGARDTPAATSTTLRTPHRMRCKWSTRTRSMSSIARRASSRLGSTISCGCWARRSLADLHCGSFREWDSCSADEPLIGAEKLVK
jgi:hypothetical protein